MPFVVVACCVGNGLCDGLITHSEESHCVCVCACVLVAFFVMYKPNKLGDADPFWAAETQEKRR